MERRRDLLENLDDGEQVFALLLELARKKAIDLTDVVVRTVPLEADAVNGVLDALDAYTAPLRTVIVP